MEVNDVVREKMLCEIIAERDRLILELHGELTVLREAVKNQGSPKMPHLVPKTET